MSDDSPLVPAVAEHDVDRFLVSLIRPEPRSYAARAGMAQRHVRDLLAALGNPERSLRVIHVAGSKGKGSTALLLEALLEQAGIATATFTSPHLERWTERFRVRGREVSASALADVFSRLAPHIDRLAAADPDNAPSFFEVMTAAAYVLFAEAGTGVAIVEAGIGGRYDATNVFDKPLACVITGIEMEHVDKLGPGLVDIARHKAGVIKPGVPLVCGRLPPVARLEIRAEAERHGAPIASLGRDFRVDAETGPDGALTLVLRLGDDTARVPTSLRASHLARNAALAVATALASGLVQRGAVVALAAAAFAGVALPGRVELLSRQPWLVVDGAHTADSMRELATALRAMCEGPRVLLVSLSGAKRAMPLLAPLLRGTTHVVVTRAEPLRSRDPAAVAAEIVEAQPDCEVECIEDPAQALARARALTPPEGLLCATGSMYVAGLARRLLLHTAGCRAAA